jgi:hypothetical protein
VELERREWERRGRKRSAATKDFDGETMARFAVAREETVDED